MNTAKYLTAAECWNKGQKLREKLDALDKKVRQALGGELCLGFGDGIIRFQIPLQDYLALTLEPSGKPALKTYEYGGVKKCYLEYPCLYVGTAKDGTRVYVDARTPAVDLVETVPAIAS